MAKFLDHLDERLTAFIQQQHMFFVATAPRKGRVNLSPKGMDTFRVLSPSRVGYLDLTGSGNETAAHLLENGRLTFMFCAFNGPPLILRLYGIGKALRASEAEWGSLRPAFGGTIPGERQLIVLDIATVQTSCGFGVPTYSFDAQRDTLRTWAEKKGTEELVKYRALKNRTSIDGLPTGF